jgi:hypothetical protein
MITLPISRNRCLNAIKDFLTGSRAWTVPE